MSEPSIGEAVDLEALVHHASQITSDLQRLWQEALDDTRRSEVGEQLRARWSAVVTAINEASKALTERLESRGLDPRLPELLPFSAQVATFSLDPTPEQALRQAQMGLLVAFDLLSMALGELLREEGDGEQPNESRDWDPSAFAIARERAIMVSNLAGFVSQAEANLLGDARIVASATPPALARLSMARAAWSHGDAEAACVHLHVGARLLIGDLLSVDSSALPVDIAEHLLAQHGQSNLGALLKLLQRSVETVVTGAETDLAVVTVLVPNLLMALDDLALRPPVELLRKAFADVVDSKPQ